MPLCRWVAQPIVFGCPAIPASGAPLAVELCLDANFDVRLQAARRFWLATEGRGPGASPLLLPNQRRQRLTLTIRALDGWLQGNSYREIAVGLFGKERISDRSWKAHDLRSRIIRLVESGRCPDARRLSRAFAPAIPEEMIVAVLGVSKLHPLIFGIPLRGPSPSLSPSTRHRPRWRSTRQRSLSDARR